MRIVFVIIIILLLGALYIAEKQKAAGEFTALSFGKLYVKWLYQITKNFKDIVVYAVKLDWTPEFNISKK